jgi:predicted TIM-barrel fold metal-dependent hydrolase
MDEAGVQRATIIPTSWDPKGNETGLEAARAFPNRLAVMGLFNPLKGPDPAAIENWKKQPGMVGIRFFLGAPPLRKWFEEGGGEWLWPILERTGTPAMIFCGGQMPVLGKIAEKYPKLKICIDSWGGLPGKKGLEAFEGFDQVLALAKYSNVTIKPVSIPFLSTEPYPYKNIQPLLRKTYDAYGPERMFWGSDLTLLPGPYKDTVRLFTDELTWLNDRDLEFIMGRSISNWLNWPLPA